jgi:hypothetical protein
MKQTCLCTVHWITRNGWMERNKHSYVLYTSLYQWCPLPLPPFKWWKCSLHTYRVCVSLEEIAMGEAQVARYTSSACPRTENKLT